MNCITTYTKEAFDPTSPEISKLNIRDVAHALSLLCRANGHFPTFYSVAQHCLNCMNEAKARGYSRRVQLACLLHDATEAYMQDLPRPIKNQLVQYNEIEERLLQAIWSKWLDAPLTDVERKQVFEVDDAMLYHEFLSFMGQEVISPQVLKSQPVLETEPFEFVERKMLNQFYKLAGINGGGTFVGVDWCKGQWLAAKIQDGFLSRKAYSSISELCSENEDANSIIIDIPVGLVEDNTESLLRPDQKARDYLKSKDRKSSVYNAPYRPVIYASDYEAANNLSRSLGKGLPRQTWSICPSIREVDEFLQANLQWKNRLVESHPEVAFQSLNHNCPITNSKHSPEGIAQRIEILREYVPDIEKALISTKSETREDLLDAVCLAVVGMVGSILGYTTIPDVPSADRTGLKMQMIICKGQ